MIRNGISVIYSPRTGKSQWSHSASYYQDATFYVSNDLMHRVDGPAVVHSSGYEEWWVNGERHREDGPAVINPEYEMMEWWQNGELHRSDGPADIWGEETIKWYQHGELHRVDGPAVIAQKGKTKIWYQKNVNHREDGPAIVQEGLLSTWVYQDKVHRFDGPAKIGADGNEEWWLFGNEVTEQEVVRFYNQVLKHLLEKDIGLVPFGILEAMFKNLHNPTPMN